MAEGSKRSTVDPRWVDVVDANDLMRVRDARQALRIRTVLGLQYRVARGGTVRFGATHEGPWTRGEIKVVRSSVEAEIRWLQTAPWWKRALRTFVTLLP